MILLFWGLFRNSPYPVTYALLRDWPGLGKDAAEYLVAKKVAAAATDALSIDVFTSTDFPAHYTLLASQVLIGENFNNLGSLPPFSLLMALPLKIQDGSGSPVRAVAFIPRKRE